MDGDDQQPEKELVCDARKDIKDKGSQTSPQKIRPATDNCGRPVDLDGTALDSADSPWAGQHFNACGSAVKPGRRGDAQGVGSDKNGSPASKGGSTLIKKVKNKLKFYLERMLLRGAVYQLLFIALLILLVSVIAGTIGFLFVADFKGIDEAVWWAFLRLSDPGYLGDDKGILLATVSTIVTVLGYVLFMGALIAIMTQWLYRTLRNLESGLTPIAQRNHILILGWTNRTAIIIIIFHRLLQRLLMPEKSPLPGWPTKAKLRLFPVTRS